MATLEGDVSGNVAEVDAAFSALHVTERPQDIKLGGSFRVCAVSGLVTGATLDATPDPIFSFRWTSSTYRCVVRYIDVQFFAPTAVTGAQEVGGSIDVARAFSAVDSGGTAITMTTNNMKKRTSHATSLVNDIRIASVAQLTAGTRTLDAQALAAFRYWELATGAAVQHGRAGMTFDARNPGTYPLVLSNTGNGEGFIVHNTVAYTTSGTQRWVVTVEWDEIINADYAG